MPSGEESGMRKWRWLTVLALLAATGYVASYPMAYRLFVGIDDDHLCYVLLTNNSPRVEFESFPSMSEQQWKAWNYLERYYFPPVKWLIDHTPLRRPLMNWASVWSVNGQLEADYTARVTVPFVIPDQKKWHELTARRRFYAGDNSLK
jgi:hypothetical protein